MAFNNSHQVNGLKVAYIMSRFPKITETFILYEMVEMEKLGAQISVYPLRREKTKAMHPEAEVFSERANFYQVLSIHFLASHIYFLKRDPKTYFATILTLIKENWGSFRYFAGAIMFFPLIVHIARKMQLDGIQFIHAHFASHPAMAAYVIHQLTGIPFSFTAHGSDLHRDQHMLCCKINSAAFTVAISEDNRKLMIEKCGSQHNSKVVVIHCGVDPTKFEYLEETALSKSQVDRPFQVLCIGTLHEVKGQRFLIEACQILKEKKIRFICHFIGDGEDRGLLEQMVAIKGLDGQVEFHGKLDQGGVIERMKSADVLVQPSVPTASGRREGIPVVLMEGMSCGLPVVSSRLSGIPELVEDGTSGVLTTPGDVSQIARAIQFLYEKPSIRHQYGLAGREKVLDDFNLTRNSETLLNLIGNEVRK